MLNGGIFGLTILLCCQRNKRSVGKVTEYIVHIAETSYENKWLKTLEDYSARQEAVFSAISSPRAALAMLGSLGTSAVSRHLSLTASLPSYSDLGRRHDFFRGQVSRSTHTLRKTHVHTIWQAFMQSSNPTVGNANCSLEEAAYMAASAGPRV